MTDRRAVHLLWIASLILALTQFTVHRGTGIDAVGYYAGFTSIVWDQDFDVRNDRFLDSNEPALTHARCTINFRGSETMLLPSGRWANPFSIGQPIIWATAGAPMLLAERLTEGSNRWHAADRYAFHYRLLCSLVTLMLSIHTLFMIYHIGRRYFPPGASAAGALLAVWGSMVFRAIVLESFISHAYALWAFTILWQQCLSLWEEGSTGRTKWQHWGLGLSLGVLGLIRHNAVIWAVLPATIYIAQMLRRDQRRAAFFGALIAGIGSMFAFSIQAIAWRSLYGSWLTIPQGAGYLGVHGLPVAMWNILFGNFNSLFLCHPWTLPALIGFVIWGRKRGAFFVGSVIGLCITLAVNALPVDWWGGAAFGSRRWSHAMPVFAMGWAWMMTAIPARWPRRLIGGGLTLGFLAWNLIMHTAQLRGTLFLNWWDQIQMWPELVYHILHDPENWMIGSVWELTRGFSAHQAFGVGLALAIVAAFIPVLLFTRGGAQPCPMHRFRSWLIPGSTALLGAWILIAILCMRNTLTPREPDGTDLILAAREAILVGDQASAISLLREAEPEFPRHVRVYALQSIDDPETRSWMALGLLSSPRLDDHFATESLIRYALRNGDATLRAQVTENHLLGWGHWLQNTQRITAQRAQRERIQLNPAEIGLLMHLAAFEEHRGETDYAARLRNQAHRWATAHFHAAEAMMLNHPEFEPHYRPQVHGAVENYMSVIDPVAEPGLAFDVLRRQRLIMKDETMCHESEVRLQERILHQISVSGVSDEHLPALMEHMVEWSSSHPYDQVAQRIMVKLLDQSGDWHSAIERAGRLINDDLEGRLDPLLLAMSATQSLTLEEINAIDPATLPEDNRALTSVAMALRALALQEPDVAREWIQRAFDFGMSPALEEAVQTRLWDSVPDQLRWN